MAFQVCTALRKMSLVLRLGVYRERIEKYGGRILSSLNDPSTPTSTAPTPTLKNGSGFSPPTKSPPKIDKLA